MIPVLFKSKIGKVALSSDGVAQYLAVVKEIKTATPSADQKAEKQLEGQLSRNLSDDLQIQFANALKNKINVTINKDGVREAY